MAFRVRDSLLSSLLDGSHKYEPRDGKGINKIIFPSATTPTQEALTKKKGIVVAAQTQL